MVIGLIAEIRNLLHQLAGTVGYGCMVVGVLMGLFSVIGARFDGAKITKAVMLIVAGAMLMDLANRYL